MAPVAVPTLEDLSLSDKKAEKESNQVDVDDIDDDDEDEGDADGADAAGTGGQLIFSPLYPESERFTAYRRKEEEEEKET